MPCLKPSLLHTLGHASPGFVYCALFQDFSAATSSVTVLPRVLTGSHDGRIRVYQDAVHKGQLGFKEDNAHLSKDVDKNHAPHSGLVNDMTIDCKSKNLFSGDSVGVILVWRLGTLHAFYLN